MNCRSLVFFLAGMLLTPLPYLRALFDTDSALLYRDLTNVQVPLKAEWIAAIHELGRVPFWDHFHLGGIPFLADASYGPLYPLNVFFLPFSPASAPRALLFFLVLHHVLLYAGGYYLARELRVRPAVALIGGLAFAWCGFAMSSDNLVHILGSQLAMPFLFVWWRRALRRNGWGPELGLGALALAWPIYAGDPQYVPMAVAACALFGLFYSRVLTRLPALLALSFCAAAPQLFPILHHLNAHGARLAQVTLASQTIWSLHPLRLLELIMPFPFMSTPDVGELRGSALVNGPHGGGIPFIFSYYTGAVLVAATGIYLAAKRWRRRWRTAALATAYASVVMLTTGSPLYALFFQAMPFWKGFRYPERLGYWLVLPILVGGIYSLERILRLRRTRAWRLPAAGAFVVFLFIGSVERNYALWAGACASLLAFLFLARSFQGRVLALTTLAALDLYFSAQRLVWPQSLTMLNANNLPLARELLTRFQEDHESISRGGPRRVLSYFEGQGIDPAQLKRAPLLALDTAEAWLFLRANTSAYFGIESVFGHGSLTPLREYLRTPCATAACETRTAQLLATRYILTAGAEGRPIVTNLEGALPYAFSVSKADTMPNAKAAYEKASALAFDYRHEVAVEGVSSPLLTERELELVEQRWDHVHLRVKPGAGPSLLMVNEAFDPYWSAGPYPLMRVNGWAMGIPVPASEQSIEIDLTYSDRSFYFGAAFFLGWLFGLCGLLVISRTGSGAEMGPKQVRA